jgi:uncharacterized protein (TIGR02284 family)
MQQNDQAAEIVNDLVKINNDRIEGYKRAINEAKPEDSDLKMTFENMVSQSQQYKQELSTIARQLGETPETGTRTDGKIYRAWMDVKATFSGNSRKAVLSNCEFGEDAAQRAYKSALASDGTLPQDVRQTITKQQTMLKTAHDTIKKMRDQEN